MAEGRCDHDWEIASQVMALIANSHKANNVKAFEASEFDYNPMSRKPPEQSDVIEVTPENTADFKQAFSGF